MYMRAFNFCSPSGSRHYPTIIFLVYPMVFYSDLCHLLALLIAVAGTLVAFLPIVLANEGHTNCGVFMVKVECKPRFHVN